MYHRVAAGGPAALAACRVHPERFEAQLDWLKRHGFRSVGLDAWLGAADRRFGELPGRAVCLTFDDGYEDFAEVAWPLLRRYGFGATVFLVADLVGGAAEWDARHGPPAPLMGWATIGRLAREGVAFGGHTATHPDLTRVGADRLAEELRRSREVLGGRLGCGVATLAYPFGFVDGLVRNAAAAAGYAVAVTTRHGHARWGDDPLLLPRVMVTDADDAGTLARRVGLGQRARRPRDAGVRRRGNGVV
jgi:peptidoglycan/xylan/chitin deacetylase (PgdA/CDA1 family)